MDFKLTYTQLLVNPTYASVIPSGSCRLQDTRLFASDRSGAGRPGMALRKQAGAAAGLAMLIKTGVEDMEEKAVRKWLSWILRYVQLDRRVAAAEAQLRQE